jgi:hypothetical protein
VFARRSTLGIKGSRDGRLAVAQPLDYRPGAQRIAVRMSACLDLTTRKKVDDVATRLHPSRAAVLCHIRQWGLSRGQTEALDQSDACGSLHHFLLYVVSELHKQGENAATATKVKAAHTKSFVRDYQRLPQHIQRRFDGAWAFSSPTTGIPLCTPRKWKGHMLPRDARSWKPV